MGEDRLLFQLPVPHPVGGAQHHTGEGEEGNGVGDDHKEGEHIGQGPHQVVAGDGAQEDEH